MRLIPRQEEVAEVVALLQASYKTPEDKAKALIKHVADLMWMRDWYVVSQKGAPWWGPFSSDAEATELMLKAPITLGQPYYLVKVHGPGKVADERKGGGHGYCVNCDPGHPAYAHRMSGNSRGSCVLCNCSGYAAEKKAPAKRAPTRKRATS